MKLPIRIMGSSLWILHSPTLATPLNVPSIDPVGLKTATPDPSIARHVPGIISNNLDSRGVLA
jgi:hypothetical protein